MTFTIVLPGQPPSGNHANKIGRGYRRGGIAYPKLVKTPQAEAYQQGAALIAKSARPSKWEPGPQVVMEYRFWLAREADCTNLIKVIEDGVCPALGFNDSRALPRAMSKQVGVPKNDARVEITIR